MDIDNELYEMREKIRIQNESEREIELIRLKGEESDLREAYERFYISHQPIFKMAPAQLFLLDRARAKDLPYTGRYDLPDHESHKRLSMWRLMGWSFVFFGLLLGFLAPWVEFLQVTLQLLFTEIVLMIFVLVGYTYFILPRILRKTRVRYRLLHLLDCMVKNQEWVANRPSELERSNKSQKSTWISLLEQQEYFDARRARDDAKSSILHDNNRYEKEEDSILD
jgi:hypothetical protein